MKAPHLSKVAVPETACHSEACRLAAIAGTTILVPYHVVKSLQVIWRSGTRAGARSLNELQRLDLK